MVICFHPQAQPPLLFIITFFQLLQNRQVTYKFDCYSLKYGTSLSAARGTLWEIQSTCTSLELQSRLIIVPSLLFLPLSLLLYCLLNSSKKKKTLYFLYFIDIFMSFTIWKNNTFYEMDNWFIFSSLNNRNQYSVSCD